MPVRYVATFLFAAAVLAGAALAWQRYRSPVRAPTPPEAAERNGVNETGLPLELPPGFRISIFAKDLPKARVMRFDGFGNLWVSRTDAGVITLLEIDRETGAVTQQNDVFQGLNKPHGLAFDTERGLELYIAEQHRLWRVATYSDDPGEDLLTFPTGGHFTRTIAFGPASADSASRGTAGNPDGKLYISIGSSCNVCIEESERRAAVLSYDVGSGKTELFARGLRNAVFFTWHPVTGKLWATEMGRDELGDDLPPDEINVVELGGDPSTPLRVNPSTEFRVNDYGWPICYGKNIHDGDFDKNVYVRDPCADKQPSAIDIPAHSAPLGLAFIPPNSKWPEDYWYDLLVAYHGSIFRSQPTGYKVVRHKFDAAGNYGGVEDFITGWLVRELSSTQAPEGALGRPVDIIVQPGGTAYISDDHAGVIYRVDVIKPPR